MTDQNPHPIRRNPSRSRSGSGAVQEKRRAIVAVAMFALLLAACGGEGANGDGDTNGAAGADNGVEVPAGDTGTSNDNEAPGDAPADAPEPPGDEPADASVSAAGALECVATDGRLPQAADRDLVALIPVPDSLTDEGDTFDASFAVSGRTNADVDPHDAVDCVDQLIGELGWEITYSSDDGSIDSPNGHTYVATHDELPDLCMSASMFASEHTPVVAGDAGTRMEITVRELPEGVACQF